MFVILRKGECLKFTQTRATNIYLHYFILFYFIPVSMVTNERRQETSSGLQVVVSLKRCHTSSTELYCSEMCDWLNIKLCIHDATSWATGCVVCTRLYSPPKPQSRNIQRRYHLLHLQAVVHHVTQSPQLSDRFARGTIISLRVWNARTIGLKNCRRRMSKAKKTASDGTEGCRTIKETLSCRGVKCCCCRWWW